MLLGFVFFFFVGSAQAEIQSQLKAEYSRYQSRVDDWLAKHSVLAVSRVLCCLCIGYRSFVHCTVVRVRCSLLVAHPYIYVKLPDLVVTARFTGLFVAIRSNCTSERDNQRRRLNFILAMPSKR